MKVAIFYSEFFQNVTQNVSIVACFQKFDRKLSAPLSAAAPHSKRVPIYI